MSNRDLRESARRELEAATRALAGPLSPEERQAVYTRWKAALEAVQKLYTDSPAEKR
jgi:hypothetical protein